MSNLHFKDFDVLPLFSTPVYKTSIQLLPEEVSFCRNVLFKKIEVGNGFVSQDNKVLDHIALDKLKTKIQQCIDHFVYGVLKCDNSLKFFFLNSWIMMHYTKNFSQSHIHRNSLLSGVLYLEVNKDSGDIVFEKEHNSINLFPTAIDINFTEDNIYNSKSWSILPESGDLLLFPSHLSHYVNCNLSNKNRFCLAFNVFVKGNIGGNDYFSEMIL